MRLFNKKIFDGVLVNFGAPQLYLEVDGPLARVDAIVFEVIIDGVSGTSPNFALYYYYTDDGANLTNQQAVIPTTSVLANKTNVLSGVITNPMGAYLVLQPMEGGTASPVMRVKIYACGRGIARKSKIQAGPRPAAARAPVARAVSTPESTGASCSCDAKQAAPPIPR